MSAILSRFTLCVLVALLLTTPSNVQASLVLGQTVGVDFGSTASADPNTTWNNIISGGNSTSGGVAAGATTSIADLLDTSNSLTGVTFGLTNNTGFNAWDFGNGNEGDGGLINHVSVFSDGLLSNDAPGQGRNTTVDVDFFTLTFSGLDDSLLYDFVGGYSRNDNGNFDGKWTIGGTSIITDSQAGTVGDGYASFTGLSTDGSGNLTITLTGDGSANQVIVAAVTLTASANAIPEPASLVLLGLGGLGMTLWRRK